MTTSLRQVIATVTMTSKEVEAVSHQLFTNAAQTNETSAQVTQSVDYISKQASLQQNNIQENCQSISQVTESIAQVAQVSENVSTISADATQYAETGQADLYKSVAQMQNVTSKVKNGVRTVNLTGQAFNKIHHATQSVSEKIQNVALIAQQMSQNTSDINAASETLELTATESATQAKDSVSLVEEQYAAMEEITAAANMLTTLAMNLNEEISRFKV